MNTLEQPIAANIEHGDLVDSYSRYPNEHKIYVEQYAAQLRAPSMEEPIQERLDFASSILNELEAREAQRMSDRWSLRPLGSATPEGIAPLLADFNRWLNGSTAGKVVKSTAKFALGAAAVSATVATGGVAGMFFAPLLFSGGIKAASSGSIELFQEFFGHKHIDTNGDSSLNSGRSNRLNLESAKQSFFNEARVELNALQSKIESGKLSPETQAEYVSALIEEIKNAENEIISQENGNIDVEKSRTRFRGLASTGISLATGILTGIPIGSQDFDADHVQHLVTFGSHGWSFNYSADDLIQNAGLTGDTYTPFDLFGRGLAHTLGGLPPLDAAAGLAAAGLGIAAKTAQELQSVKHVGSPEFSLNEYVESIQIKPVEHVSQSEATNPLSPRLRENPNAKLDHFQELSDYFQRQSRENVATAIELADQIVTPMSEECRIAVCIPVAGHQEGKNIYNTLKNYSNQRTQADDSRIDPNSYEIILYVNHPDDVEPDSTLEEIERFKTDYPDLPVRVMYDRLLRENANMYHIRKSLTDASMVRHHRRGNSAQDLIVVSNDADNAGMSPYYLYSYLQKFEKSNTEGKNFDGIGGRLDWDPEAMRQHPIALLTTRMAQYIEIKNRYPEHGQPYYNTSGANFAFKSSIYGAVGGYPESQGRSKEEDMAIGEAIKAGRNNHPDTIGFGMKNSKIFTSARRSLEAVAAGYAPYQQWSKLKFGPDDELRKKSVADFDQGVSAAEALSDPAKKEEFCITLSLLLNRQLKAWGIDANNKSPARALAFLNIPYTVRNGLVLVNPEEIDSLLHDLVDYHDFVALDRFKRNITPKTER